ncbi:TetR/AcrR family transcriptional regulator [Chryseomicrobium sp. FSL W7-1435]|uniref:TetR/AcrR family transcriptional regulator n=1 Tax=Chryseomicrobium sp. FSL W7-1435 TaxID=2921704 RepID=UPI00315B1A2E
MTEGKHLVKTSVKDEQLITKRRRQMIGAGVKLFKEKGFHRTTTREIAKEAGFSIGTLYEYIRTKEDVLYLVCDSIYDEVFERIESVGAKNGTLDELVSAIRYYYSVINDMQDEFVVMYQETKSLPKEALSYVLQKEEEMTAIFRGILQSCVKSGALSLNEREIDLYAHSIFTQGQMWAYRRWALHKTYSIDEFTDLQVAFILRGLGAKAKGEL